MLSKIIEAAVQSCFCIKAVLKIFWKIIMKTAVAESFFI